MTVKSNDLIILLGVALVTACTSVAILPEVGSIQPSPLARVSLALTAVGVLHWLRQK